MLGKRRGTLFIITLGAAAVIAAVAIVWMLKNPYRVIEVQPPTRQATFMPATAALPPTVTRLPTGAICPRNCAEARSWGYTAQQAAQCELDRDNDGVACYGD